MMRANFSFRETLVEAVEFKTNLCGRNISRVVVSNLNVKEASLQRVFFFFFFS